MKERTKDMIKKILCFGIAVIFCFSVFTAIPQKAKANVYMSDEIAEKFIDIFYTTETENAEALKQVLTGEKQGSESEIETLYSLATSLYGFVDNEEMIEALTNKTVSNYAGNVGNLVSFVSGALEIYDNIGSFATSDNAMQKTVDAFQIGVSVLDIFGASSYIPPYTTLALTTIELGLSVGGVLEAAYFEEGLELYKMNLQIEYHTDQELTYQSAPKVTGLGLTQEQADAQYAAAYMEYYLKRVMDAIPNSPQEEKPITYTLSLNSNHPEINDTYTEYGENAVATLPNFSSVGDYIFKGWYYDSNFSNKVSGQTMTMTQNYTLYAKWVRQYSYTVKGNNATITDFNGCLTIDGQKVTDIIVPSNIDGYTVTAIGNQAFEGAEITTAVLPDSVDTIGYFAFSYCDRLTRINIPNGIKYIEIGCFCGCYSLADIEIPDSVTYIDDSAFCGCASLADIEILDSVTHIGEMAFAECYSLVDIKIPDSVQRIDPYAFVNCFNLETVTISEGLEFIGRYAFLNCKNLKMFYVDNNNSYFSEKDGHLFNKDKSKLIRYAPNRNDTHYIIPQGVTEIVDGAFHRSMLEKVTIPDGVTYIGEAAFNYCEKLKEVIIPNSVNFIGELCFYNHTMLNDVYYSGSSDEWNNITVDSNNNGLTSARIHYNYKYVTDEAKIVDDGKTTKLIIKPEEALK